MLLHQTGSVLATLPGGAQIELGPHPSSAAVTETIDQLLRASGLIEHLVQLPGREATPEDLALVHDRSYIRRVADLSAAGGGDAGDVAPVGPQSYLAASLAAGSAMQAVDEVLRGTVQSAFVLTRPPGHHATASQGMGYCLFNNAAIAARHALSRGCERVLIVDWDVHHGNGTQSIFYSDPQVLCISLHQEDWYPAGYGSLSEVGEGPGIGATINVPLPPGTGDRGYLEAMDSIVIPAARRFRPQLIVLSAGQDAAMLDPLGRMLVSAVGFRMLAQHVRQLAMEQCGGRLVALQEGGYNRAYTPFCTLQVLEGLTGLATGMLDYNHGSSEEQYAQRTYSEETRLALAAARATHHEHRAPR